MLQAPATFPYAGSHGFLRGGQPARILQRRGDGRLTVALTDISPHHPDRLTAASGNRTIDHTEIFATREEAEHAALPPARRNRRATRTAAPRKARRA